jgi:hypothetical protein
VPLYDELGPLVWPECEQCGEPFVLRRAITVPAFTSTWLWQPDCRHKMKAPKMVERMNAYPLIFEARLYELEKRLKREEPAP